MSQNDVIIRVSREWELPSWRAVLEYRDLLYVLVRREFLAKYKQTILGPLWHIVQPLLTAILFAAIFGRAAQISTEGIPPILFYLTGLLSWGYFVQCLDTIARSLVNNAHLFQKVYFPRILIPLSIIVSKIFAYGIQLAILFVFIAICHLHPAWNYSFHAGWHLLFIPLLFLQTAMLALGTGLWIAALSTQYRDFHHLLSFIIQLWMYATPIIYPLSMIQEKWRYLILLNPMCSVVENYRSILFNVGGVDSWAFFTSLAITLGLLVSGLYTFQRVEKKFVDTL